MCREAGAAFTTCVASAPACLGPGGVQACLRGELDGPCVRACACGPEATREACLIACGEGPGGAAALALTDACLVDCPAHAACLAAPAVDCVGLCDGLAACDVQGERCVTACRAAPDVALAGCVADAARLQGGCAAVRACVGEPAPAVDPGCLALCAAQARCTGEEPIDCALRCGASGPETAIRAACAATMDCGRQAVCDALDGTLNPSCGPLCRAAAACGLDEPTCRATCTGVLATGRDPGYLTRVPACLRDGCDAAAAARCLVPPVRPCEVLCEAAAACGDADEVCVAACDEAGRLPEETSGYVLEWDAACP
ncbi:MAG: hypothetical protein H6706_17785 [Myxococcales bacterium]|nr:hypothetical protein [Myxococcales bacterium]